MASKSIRIDKNLEVKADECIDCHKSKKIIIRKVKFALPIQAPVVKVAGPFDWMNEEQSVL